MYRSEWLDKNTGSQFEDYNVQTTAEERYIELEKMFREVEEKSNESYYMEKRTLDGNSSKW